MDGSPDDFFLKIPEPQRSEFLFLRHFLLEESGLEEAWKFNTPFYYFHGKWFAFISYNAKKNHELYISFVRGDLVTHPALLSEGRKQQRIYRIAPGEDIDVDALKKIVTLLKGCY
ncbi:MAG: DUF1801 domain-containing protein [Bacteroidia bacterium]|nr:DUF1801 domain-containing protein [Bacteroidia bacterium]